MTVRADVPRLARHGTPPAREAAARRDGVCNGRDCPGGVIINSGNGPHTRGPVTPAGPTPAAQAQAQLSLLGNVFFVS